MFPFSRPSCKTRSDAPVAWIGAMPAYCQSKPTSCTLRRGTAESIRIYGTGIRSRTEEDNDQRECSANPEQTERALAHRRSANPEQAERALAHRRVGGQRGGLLSRDQKRFPLDYGLRRAVQGMGSCVGDGRTGSDYRPSLDRAA